jgi:hypothetical protein
MPTPGELKTFLNGKTGRWDGTGWEDVTPQAREGADIFQQLLSGVDASQSLTDQLKSYLTADTRAETATINAGTAASVAAIHTAKATVDRLSAETNAVNAAHSAAGLAGVHPSVFHTSEYQMGKLNLTVTQELKLFDLKLDDLRGRLEHELNVASATDLDNRRAAKIIDLQRRLLKLREELYQLQTSDDPEELKKAKIRVTRDAIRALEIELDSFLGKA